MAKERRLGRGLEALLGKIGTELPGDEAGTYQPATTIAGPTTPENPDYTPSVAESGHAVPASDQSHSNSDDLPPAQLQVPVDLIDSNPFQPREDFDETELQQLADSLQQHGLLQPVVLRRTGQRYQLVAGERRLRAAIKAGWSSVPAVLVEVNEQQMAELAIVENLQRKDLNAIEKALCFQRYLETFNITQDQLAKRLGLDRSTICNFIRLLELPEAVKDAVRSGKISQGHARALLALGDEHQQLEFCDKIIREGLSVRQTEAMVREALNRADSEPLRIVGTNGTTKPVQKPSDHHLASLEEEFRMALGTRVQIVQGKRGRGKLIVHFHDHDEFERLRQLICEGSFRPRRLSQAG